MKKIYNLKNTNMYIGAEQKTRPKPRTPQAKWFE